MHCCLVPIWLKRRSRGASPAPEAEWLSSTLERRCVVSLSRCTEANQGEAHGRPLPGAAMEYAPNHMEATSMDGLGTSLTRTSERRCVQVPQSTGPLPPLDSIIHVPVWKKPPIVKLSQSVGPTSGPMHASAYLHTYLWMQFGNIPSRELATLRACRPRKRQTLVYEPLLL